MVSLLPAKAEVVLAVQIVTRHRAPRLAALLGLGIAALAASSGPSPDRIARVVLLVAGTLAGVSASRLLSPGPALAAGRMVVARWWLVPTGRLIGALCVVGPATVGVTLALASASPRSAPIVAPTVVALAYAACVAACTMAMAPALGASAAASVSFLGVWFGGVPPSTMAVLFAGWPPVQRIVIWLWNVLPVPWRATRWLASGGWADPLLLGAWTLLGLGVAALYLAGPRSAPRAES